MLIESDLRWPVPKDGYVVRGLSPGTVGTPLSGAARPGPGQYLIAADTSPGAPEVQTEPMSRPRLYLEFAKLNTRGAIVSFASKHGLLGRPIRATVSIGERWTECEAIGLWLEEADSLAQSVALWRRLRDGRAVSVEDFLALPLQPLRFEDRARRDTVESLRSQTAIKIQKVGLSAAIDDFLIAQVGATSAPSRRRRSSANLPAIQSASASGLITHQLREAYRDDGLVVGLPKGTDLRLQCFGVLCRRMTEYVQRLMPWKVRWNAAAGQFELVMAPNTLLGAMWAQFVDSLTGREHRPCLECGRLIDVSRRPDSGNRIDRRYCEQKCKAKAHRRRDRQPPTSGKK